MKRFIAPGFTALLLIASLASASPALSVPDLSANASSLQTPACAKATPSFMTPKATEKSDHPACGACSVAVCVGADDGTVCGTAIGGQYKYCRPTGPLCQDGAPYADFRCTCTTGIVP
jgi:hypothetical protein